MFFREESHRKLVEVSDSVHGALMFMKKAIEATVLGTLATRKNTCVVFQNSPQFKVAHFGVPKVEVRNCVLMFAELLE